MPIARTIPMPPMVRCVHALYDAAIATLALNVLLILSTGGYSFVAGGITITMAKLGPPTILLLVLVILRFFLRGRGFSWDVFLSHPAPILFSVLLVLYLGNGKTIWSGDGLPARYLPLSILRHGNFYLDEFPFLHVRDHTVLPYFVQQVKDHYVSSFPVGAALLAVPFYLPTAFGSVRGDSPFIAELEKLSAAAIVAVSATLLYVLLCRLTSRKMSLLVTAAYAMGTSSFSVSSQALWQHGPSQLAVTAALYCLVRGRTEPRWVAFSGFPLAFAVLCRPTDLLIALPVVAYVVLRHPGQVGGFMVSALPPVLFQLWYNTAYLANSLQIHPSTAGVPLLQSRRWHTSFWEGLTGILLSPARGLFVYSPILLFAVPTLGLAWRRKGDPLLRCLGVAVLLIILRYSKWAYWWGGHTYGPRLLADLTPLLALSLYPIKDALIRSRPLKAVFLLALAWSIGAHSLGAFVGDYAWNMRRDVDWTTQSVFWRWTDNQLVNSVKLLSGRAMVAVRGLPTSRNEPTRLSASYHADPPAISTATVAQPIGLSLTATNIGQAVWLEWSRDGKGVVGLGWRWREGEQSMFRMEGRAPLSFNVFPQETHEFRVAIRPPEEPGTYFLEIGLVSESVAWFSDLGTPPIRSTVTVVP